MAAKRALISRRFAAAVAWVWLFLFALLPARAQEELHTLKHPAWVGSVAFNTKEGVLFTACADGNVREWNAHTGKEVSVLKSHADVVSSLTFEETPGFNKYLLVTGSYDGSVRTWAKESKKREEFKSRTDHRGAVLALATDQKSLIASGGMDGTIKLTDSSVLSQFKTLRGHKSWVNSLDFSHGGGFLVSGSSDGTVRFWRMAGDSSEPWGEPIEASKTEVRCVKLSARYDRLAVGLRYGDVQLWDSRSRKKLRSFKAHDGDCWAVRFSPNSRILITGGGDWGKPGEVKFWNVESGELLTTLKHSGEVLCLALDYLGNRLAAGGGDGNVKVWNTEKLIGVPKAE